MKCIHRSYILSIHHGKAHNEWNPHSSQGNSPEHKYDLEGRRDGYKKGIHRHLHQSKSDICYHIEEDIQRWKLYGSTRKRSQCQKRSQSQGWGGLLLSHPSSTIFNRPQTDYKIESQCYSHRLGSCRRNCIQGIHMGILHKYRTRVQGRCPESNYPHRHHPPRNNHHYNSSIG